MSEKCENCTYLDCKNKGIVKSCGAWKPNYETLEARCEELEAVLKESVFHTKEFMDASDNAIKILLRYSTKIKTMRELIEKQKREYARWQKIAEEKNTRIKTLEEQCRMMKECLERVLYADKPNKTAIVELLQSLTVKTSLSKLDKGEVRG